jgi:L-aminopeptidase/D-esterase-like protein
MGFDAAAVAVTGPVATGVVGAGTGAVVGRRWKGGVGTASLRLPAPDGDVVVGALAVVNAAGLPQFGGAGLWTGPFPAEPGGGGPALNTTLVVVATDADLDPAETSRTATAAHDGLARALDPAHTLADGDTVFALATGARPLHGPDRASRVASLVALQQVAAEVVRRAVLDGVLAAEDTPTPGGVIERFRAPRVGVGPEPGQDRHMGPTS